ncbi:MAG: serpin family protein [Chloroflexi bacterium]|nr:serpin family protein [Chloroflexota bacterium]
MRQIASVLALMLCACAGAPLPAPTAPPAEPMPTATSAETPGSAGKPRAPQRLDPAFLRAVNEFALELTVQLGRQDAGQNVFLSPANVAVALAMTANGARGETLQSMLSALNLNTLDLETVNSNFAALQALLVRDEPGATIAIANALWARAGVAFNADFLQRTQRFYDARIEALDFDQPDAPKTINEWVRRQTNDKIPAIVERIPEEIILLLMSAIYFNGKWETPFNPEFTQDRPFYLLNGTTKELPTMYRSDNFEYLKGDGFQAVRLPYAGGGVRMVIILPDADRTLTQLMDQLSIENWESWREQFSVKEGQLYLPRFTTRYDKQLNQALSAMGMTEAFDDGRADFSGMRPVPPALFISQVRHVAYVDVNEAGTEAAAVTSVEMGITSAMPTETFLMQVDRPFFFAIEETSTGSILFTGLITEP